MTDSRAKGRRGETTALRMCEDRDYSCEDMSCGKSSCDFLAIKDGTVWAVEVKDRSVIDVRAHRNQARRNAKKGMRWMLMCHWPDTSSWIVERQGLPLAVWHQKGAAHEVV